MPDLKCDYCGDEWVGLAEEEDLADGTESVERVTYRVPGVEGEFQELLCVNHRPDGGLGQDPLHEHFCDSCGSFLGLTKGIRRQHERDAHTWEEARDHGYTDLLDRPPFRITVYLCPPCHGRLSGSSAEGPESATAQEPGAQRSVQVPELWADAVAAVADHLRRHTSITLMATGRGRPTVAVWRVSRPELTVPKRATENQRARLRTLGWAPIVATRPDPETTQDAQRWEYQGEPWEPTSKGAGLTAAIALEALAVVAAPEARVRAREGAEGSWTAVSPIGNPATIEAMRDAITQAATERQQAKRAAAEAAARRAAAEEAAQRAAYLAQAEDDRARRRAAALRKRVAELAKGQNLKVTGSGMTVQVRAGPTDRLVMRTARRGRLIVKLLIDGQKVSQIEVHDDWVDSDGLAELLAHLATLGETDP